MYKPSDLESMCFRALFIFASFWTDQLPLIDHCGLFFIEFRYLTLELHYNLILHVHDCMSQPYHIIFRIASVSTCSLQLEYCH